MNPLRFHLHPQMGGGDINVTTKQWDIMKSTSVKQERTCFQAGREVGNLDITLSGQKHFLAL